MKNNQIKKHEKAILLLEAIDRATKRILTYDTDVKRIEKAGLWSSDFYRDRKEITIKVKARLQNYYNINFKIK